LYNTEELWSTTFVSFKFMSPFGLLILLGFLDFFFLLLHYFCICEKRMLSLQVHSRIRFLKTPAVYSQRQRWCLELE